MNAARSGRRARDKHRGELGEQHAEQRTRHCPGYCDSFEWIRGILIAAMLRLRLAIIALVVATARGYAVPARGHAVRTVRRATPSDNGGGSAPTGGALSAAERKKLFQRLAQDSISEKQEELAKAKSEGNSERCEEIETSIAGLKQQQSDADGGSSPSP